jgi:hypothetical protein
VPDLRLAQQGGFRVLICQRGVLLCLCLAGAFHLLVGHQTRGFGALRLCPAALRLRLPPGNHLLVLGRLAQQGRCLRRQHRLGLGFRLPLRL